MLAKYITSSTLLGLKPHLTNISEHTVDKRKKMDIFLQ